MWQNIGHSIYFPLELFGAVIVCSFFNKKRDKILKQFLTAFLITISIVIIYIVAEPNDVVFGSKVIIRYGIYCFSIFIGMVIGVWICCLVSWKEAVFCVTCAYLIEHVAYCIRVLINTVTKSAIADVGTLVYILIHVSVYILCYFIFIRRMVRDNHYEASLQQSLWTMSVALFLVLFMSVVAVLNHFQWIHSIYAILCCMFVLYSLVNQMNQLTLQRELFIKEQLWLKHNAQYEMSKENIEIINRKCHDLKHQVAALRKINNIERYDEVIDSIENSIMIYDSILDTGSKILDTVLTEKSLICNENNIKITCITDGKLLDFMDTIDLYTLFGNALDNAIEGVNKIEEGSRHISLLVHEKVNLIFIQFENPYVGEVKMKNGIPVSSKPVNGYHGYGIRSIIQVAEKYEGFVTIEAVDHIFVVRITIPYQK